MDEISWQKLNALLRIVGIVVMLLIAGAILYNKYGSPPNLEDQQLLDKNGLKITDCKELLMNYGKGCLGIQLPTSGQLDILNASNWEIKK